MNPQEISRHADIHCMTVDEMVTAYRNGINYISLASILLKRTTEAIAKLPSSSAITGVEKTLPPDNDGKMLASHSMTEFAKENNRDIILLLDEINNRWLLFLEQVDDFCNMLYDTGAEGIAMGMIDKEEADLNAQREELEEIMSFAYQDKLMEGNELATTAFRFIASVETIVERFVRDAIGMEVYSYWKPRGAFLADSYLLFKKQQAMSKFKENLGGMFPGIEEDEDNEDEDDPLSGTPFEGHDLL